MTSANPIIQETELDKTLPGLMVTVADQSVVVEVGGNAVCLYTEAKLWLVKHFGPDALQFQPPEVLYKAVQILSKTTIPGPFWKYRFEQMLATGLTDAVILATLIKLCNILITGSTLVAAVKRMKFISALQTIEQRGIPVGSDLLQRLRDGKNKITSALRVKLDASCPFSRQGEIDTILLSKFIINYRLLWPVTKAGRLKTDMDTLAEMALAVPCLREFVSDYKLLNSLKRDKLELGADSRVRCPARPFSTKTGRNAPSSNAYILSLSKHYRSLIQPAADRALAVIDYKSQDIGIAAALSGDANLLEDYFAEDVYISFLVRSGQLPIGASKRSHPLERDIAKVVMLGVGYGMTPYGVACRLKITEREANNLIEAHQKRYPTLWKWQENIIKTANSDGLISSQSGWSMRVDKTTKSSTLRNWLIQAAGADILRQAVLLCQQSGVDVIATNHDALMVESDLISIERITKQTAQCMADASQMVIGVALNTESSIYKFPNNFYPQQRAELEQLLNVLRK